MSISQVLFCMSMNPEKCEVNRNTRKNEAVRHPVILTKQTWSIKDSLLIWPKREPFLSETTGEIPSKQDGSILPTQITNENKTNTSFFGTCPFSHVITGLSLRAGGQVFPPASMNVASGYFYWKIKPKEIPSCLIPHLLVVFTWQLEILVTTL